MKCNEMLQTVDALNETYIKIWADVCNIESPTKFKEGVDACGEYFAELARQKGWKVEYFRQPVAGDVVDITLNPDSEEKPIIFSGHLDTVHPVGSFGTPAVKIEGNKMFGPGVCDCKGGAVAAFMAMDALDRHNFRGRPVKLILQTDEEVSSAISNKKTIGYMCEEALKSVAFLNLEGHKDNKASITRKGILRYRVDVRGKASHSANCHKGVNAIVEAAHEIIELEKMKQVEGGISCNCGMIEGGTTPNTVAEECCFTADIRFANAAQQEQAREAVARVTQNVTLPGCTSTATQISFRPAMEEVERNHALLNRANEIYEAYGLPRLIPTHAKGGSDAAYVTIAGIPCMDSIGTEGEDIHSIRERMELPSLVRCAKRVAAVACCIEDQA